jgi:hypothetical protein
MTRTSQQRSMLGEQLNTPRLACDNFVDKAENRSFTDGAG